MLLGEIEEGVQSEIGGSPFRQVGLVGDGDGYASHPGRFCGDDAIEGVFEGQALQGAHGEGLGAVHVYLGMGLAVGQVFGGGHGLEIIFDPQSVHDDLYQGERGGSRQTDAEMVGSEESDDLLDAGERLGLCFDLFDHILMECGGGSWDLFFADAELTEPVIQPFRCSETGGVMILYG